MTSSNYPLWSDEPATQDLLSFRAVAETAADAIFDDMLDPVAIGLSGAWGSGKTSELELIRAEITSAKRHFEAIGVEDYARAVPGAWKL